jgi:FkbM family methyltransferase
MAIGYDLVRRVKAWILFYRDLILSLGFAGFALYKLQRLRMRFFGIRTPYTLCSKYARFRLLCRPNTSDMEVFWQIFVKREYRCLDDVKQPKFILDCGANIGYSAAYFLTRFPEATLTAVEPDPANCAMLETNLARFTGRYRVVRSAIWSEETGLAWEETPYRGGQEWSRMVRRAKPGEVPFIFATTIGCLLSESQEDRISILKIDIERSELALFSANYKEWLDRIDNLTIELHDEECASVFHGAIADQGFTLFHCDELTVCRRSRQGSTRLLANAH